MWQLFILTFIFSLMSFFEQVSPSVMSSELQTSFGLDIYHVMLLSNVFLAIYMLMQIPGGMLFSRFSAKKVIPTVLLLFTCGMFLSALSPNVTSFLIARILLGVASGFAYLSVLYVGAQGFDRKFYPFIVGLGELSAGVGAILAETPLKLMIQHFGWRASLLFLSTVMLIVFVLSLYYVRKLPKKTDKPTPFKTVLSQLVTICKKRQVQFICLYSGLMWMPFLAFAGFWGIHYLKAIYQISTLNASTMMLMGWLGLGICSSFVGMFSNFIRRRKGAMVGLAVLGMVVGLIMVYTPMYNNLQLYSLIFLLGLAAVGAPLSFSALHDILPQKYTSISIGLCNAAIVFGGFLGELLLGSLRSAMLAKVPTGHVANAHLGDIWSIAGTFIPLCFLAALLISLYFIKESHTKKSF